MYTFALLLALQAPAVPADPTLAEARTVIVNGLDEFERTLTGFSGYIDSRFAADSEDPRTGFAVESAEDVGPDGLHAVTVKTVLVGSPADDAGIRPGDRILRIGGRRLEHEPPQVVRMLTDGTAGPLDIALRRGAGDLTVSVKRAPIKCVQRSSARIDRKRWLGRVAEMRSLSAIIRSELDERTVPEEERYGTSVRHLSELYSLFQEVAGLLSLELADALAKECSFKVPE